MTHKDIIRLAMAYGFTGSFDVDGNLTYDATFVEAVTEAVANEREACAKVCDELAELNRFSETDSMWEWSECSAAIRARGKE
jgi:hypothetical protein